MIHLEFQTLNIFYGLETQPIYGVLFIDNDYRHLRLGFVKYRPRVNPLQFS